MTNLTHSSELMENQLSAVAFAPQGRFAVLQDNAGHLMLFSIGTDRALRLTLESEGPGTGWIEIDLTSALSAGPPVCDAFAATQDQSGHLRLAVAIRASNESADSQLYFTDSLSGDPGAIDWTEPEALWRAHPFAADRRVTRILMGTNDDDAGAPLTFVTTRHSDGKTPQHYFVNPSDQAFREHHLPENADEFLDLSVGTHPNLGRGLYVLYRIGEDKTLEFTGMPTEYGVPPTVSLVPPPGTHCLRLAPSAQGRSDVYCGGDGVYLFAATGQLSGAIATPVDTSAAVHGVTDLLTTQDEQVITLWCKNDREELVYLEAKRPAGSESAPRFGSPVRLMPSVAEFSALRNSRHGAHELFTLGAGGDLSRLFQDPRTSLWRRDHIPVPDTGHTISFSSYTTHVHLEAEDGAPAAGQPIEVLASQHTPVLINGEYHVLTPDAPKTVHTDSLGNLNLVNQVADLSVSCYHLSADCLEGSVAINPAAKVQAGLGRVQSASDLHNAKAQNRKPVVDDSVSKHDVTAVADALKQMVPLTDALAPDESGQSGRWGAVGQRTRLERFALHIDAEGIRFADGTAAAAALPAFEHEVEVLAGDFFLWCEGTVEAAAEVVVEAAEEGFSMVVQWGEEAYKVLIEDLSQALKAIAWLLEKIKLAIEKLIAWLGFLFDWDDILTTHRVMRNLVDLGLDHLVDTLLAELRGETKDRFAELRERIDSGNIGADRSNAIFEGSGRDRSHSGTSSHQSPQSNWGLNQLSNNGGSATPIDWLVPGDLIDDLDRMAERELETLELAFNRIGDSVIPRVGKAPLGELLNQILEILAVAVLDSVENVVLGVLDIAELALKAFRALLEARWNIPVLTFMYEQIICKGDGSRLTLLDLICLVTAIPTTIMIKSSGLGESTFQRTSKRLLSAKRIDDLLPAANRGGPHLRTQRVVAPAPPCAPAPLDSGTIEAVIWIQWILTGVRMISTIASGVQTARILNARRLDEKQPESAEPLQLGFDTVAFACSAISASIVLANSRSSAAYRTLDSIVSYTRALYLAKDWYLLVKSQRLAALVSPAPDPAAMLSFKGTKSTLEAAEAVLALLLLGVAIASICDEHAQKPSRSQSQTDMINLKFAQRFGDFADHVSAPFLEWPAAGPYAKVVRVLGKLDKTGCSMGRAIIETRDRIVDLD